MAITSPILNIDDRRLSLALRDAAKKLNSADGEAILDFSSVRRIDAGALRALEELARVAEENAVTVVISGINVDVYKVLELVKLTKRFSFVD